MNAEPVKEIAGVANGAIDALKSQPLALALVVINVLFLLVGVWVVWEISTSTSEIRTALLAQLQCK